MSLDWEPAKLEQIAPCFFVTKHPGVKPIKVKPSPVRAMPPVFGFLRMCTSGVTVCFVEHPPIQTTKDLFGNGGTKVVCPSSNDWVELAQNCLDIASLCFVPELLDLLSHLLH